MDVLLGARARAITPRAARRAPDEVGHVDVGCRAREETEPDEVLRYFMTIYSADPPPPRPALTGGPLDALVLSIDYGYGRLGELVEQHAGGWIEAWAQPWIISALSATGHTARALELYEAMRARGLTSSSCVTPKRCETASWIRAMVITGAASPCG